MLNEPPATKVTPVDPRVAMAAERTLLAWIRTGLALMGFGFVVARFAMLLRELAAMKSQDVEPRTGTSMIGIAFVVAGILVILVSVVRYGRMNAEFARGRTPQVLLHAPLALAAFGAAGGAILVWMLLAAVGGR